MRESLKEILEDIVKELETKEVDLEITPALFNWRYPDNPEINYQLLIRKGWEEEDMVGGNSNVH